MNATPVPSIIATGTQEWKPTDTTNSPARAPRKIIGPAGSGTFAGGVLWASSDTLPRPVRYLR